MNKNIDQSQSFFEKHKYGVRRTVFLGTASLLASGMLFAGNKIIGNSPDNVSAASQENSPAHTGYPHQIESGETLSDISEDNLQQHHEVADPSSDQISERGGEITKENPDKVGPGGTLTAGDELDIPADTEVESDN